ncbi:uncharacterized protein LOC113458106 [Microtus ochrogaster]|uniref:Uncharacterized protein LOC113458106 n=1 Tax=Microtus ochrogaster TaxID=79684 RepID=A0ABM1UQS1_MICOH|nr:uncharacterized protein LOC113458106 [Microtus ochrogaster]
MRFLSAHRGLWRQAVLIELAMSRVPQHLPFSSHQGQEFFPTSCCRRSQGNQLLPEKWGQQCDTRHELAYPLQTLCTSFLTAHHVVASFWLVLTRVGVMWQRTQAVGKGTQLSNILQWSRCLGSPFEPASGPHSILRYFFGRTSDIRSLQGDLYWDSPFSPMLCLLSSSTEVKGLLEPMSWRSFSLSPQPRTCGFSLRKRGGGKT